MHPTHVASNETVNWCMVVWCPCLYHSLSLSLPACLPACLSICLSVCLSVCLCPSVVSSSFFAPPKQSHFVCRCLTIIYVLWDFDTSRLPEIFLSIFRQIQWCFGFRELLGRICLSDLTQEYIYFMTSPSPQIRNAVFVSAIRYKWAGTAGPV